MAALGLARVAAQQFGHRLQHLVGAGVALAQIHAVEVAQTQQEQAHAARAGTIGQGLPELGDEHAAVGQAGQRVGMGVAAQRLHLLGVGGDQRAALLRDRLHRQRQGLHRVIRRQAGQRHAAVAQATQLRRQVCQPAQLAATRECGRAKGDRAQQAQQQSLHLRRAPQAAPGRGHRQAHPQRTVGAGMGVIQGHQRQPFGRRDRGQAHEPVRRGGFSLLGLALGQGFALGVNPSQRCANVQDTKLGQADGGLVTRWHVARQGGAQPVGSRLVVHAGLLSNTLAQGQHLTQPGQHQQQHQRRRSRAIGRCQPPPAMPDVSALTNAASDAGRRQGGDGVGQLKRFGNSNGNGGHGGQRRSRCERGLPTMSALARLT